MAAIVLKVFGGEVPALSGNALPPEAAQVAENLFAGVAELRPLQNDLNIMTVPPATRSLYRMQRRGDGQLYGETDQSQGWIVSGSDRSYVRGQIHDDDTERTYMTDNTSGPWPMVFDRSTVTTPRRLGVPEPAVPTCEVVAVKTPFTRAAANTAGASLVGKVIDAIRECTIDPRQGPNQQRASRYKNYVPSNGVPRAARLEPRNGPKSNYRMGPTEDGLLFPGSTLTEHYGYLWAGRPTSETVPLFGNLFSWRPPGNGYTFFELNAMPPSWLAEAPDPANPGRYLLETKLRAFKHPVTNATLFSDDSVVEMLQVFIAGARMKERMPGAVQELDEIAREFSELIYDTPNNAAPSADPRPVEPTKPTVPQMVWEDNTSEPGG